MARPTLLGAVKDLDRLRQIVAVLVRHGFGELIARTGLGALVVGKSEARPNQGVGERVRLALQDLGPSFIKLGQVASTRPDLIPAEVLPELRKLQDQVQPVPFDQIRAAIEEELDGTLEELFEQVYPEPLASASIGQVHRARIRLEDGSTREVVIKVQRPGIKPTVERDMELLYMLAQAVERSVADARIYAPSKLVAEFDRAMSSELDFTVEAEHALRFGKNFEGHPEVKFPRVYLKWSSKRVLTQEYFDGCKIYDALSQGYDPTKLTRSALEVVIKSVFEDGFFHADPHPGNAIIMGDPDSPVIGLIDLGSVGHLTPQLRDKTIDLMVATAQGEYRAIADSLYAIGTPTRRVDRGAFEADVGKLVERFLGKPLGEIQVSELVRELVSGATKHGLEIPPDFLMVAKALMTIEGVARAVAPGFDIYQEMKPHFMRLLAQRYAPDRMLPELLRSLSRLSSQATDFPGQANEILEELRRGRFEIKVREPSLPQSFDVIGRRIQAGFILAALIMGSAFLTASGHWAFGASFFLMAIAWGLAHTLMTWWVNRKRR